MAFGRTERVGAENRFKGFKVSAKKMGPSERAAVGALFSQGGLRKSESCTIVLFHGERGRITATQRCSDRKLHAHNKRQPRGPRGRFRKRGR